jgi:rhamnosyltransferase
MLSKLMTVETRFAADGKAVLVGPKHEDYQRKISSELNEEVSIAPLLITSGSLVTKRLVELVGYYDERLFIDHVDHDFCLRIFKLGGECYQVNGAILLHKFGEAKVKTFLGKTFFLQEYSPFRRYHMMRNRIVLYKRYGMFRGKLFWIDLKSAVKDLVKLLLFEPGKASKIRSVIRGFFDGLRWKD